MLQTTVILQRYSDFAEASARSNFQFWSFLAGTVVLLRRAVPRLTYLLCSQCLTVLLMSVGKILANLHFQNSPFFYQEPCNARQELFAAPLLKCFLKPCSSSTRVTCLHCSQCKMFPIPIPNHTAQPSR